MVWLVELVVDVTGAWRVDDKNKSNWVLRLHEEKEVALLEEGVCMLMDWLPDGVVDVRAELCNDEDGSKLD